MNQAQNGNPRLFLMAVTAVATMGGLLFGFDMAVISGVLPFIKQQFALNSFSEGWFVSCALVGCIIGVALAGELCDRFGRKRMLMLAAILFFVSALGTAAAGSFIYLIAARMMGGMGVGVASIVAPLYISEIAPAKIRGRLVTFYQLAITAGILVAYLTNAGLLTFSLNHRNQLAGHFIDFILVKQVWRGMLGLGTIPALLFFIGVLFVPESPRWLIQNGRQAEADNILRRIIKDEAIKTGVQQPDSPTAINKGSYRELLSPAMRRPLLIGILLPLFSQFSGINAVIYYGPRVLNAAGINISIALLNQIVFGLANFLFTLVAIWKVDQLGRRPLYITGSLGAAICLFLTGFSFYNSGGHLLLLISIVCFLACFAFSIGPLKFVIAAEIFPTRIRGRAMALSIMVMWVADTIVGQLTPVFLTAFGPAFTFWFFSFCCLISFFVVYKLVPETKGKSLEDVQDFWVGH